MGLQLIDSYERIAGITAQMAQAASDRDWEAFEDLQERCVKLVQQVKKMKKTPLKGAQLRRKIVLIMEIMSNDKSIREVTEPWQQQVETIYHPEKTYSLEFA